MIKTVAEVALPVDEVLRIKKDAYCRIALKVFRSE